MLHVGTDVEIPAVVTIGERPLTLTYMRSQLKKRGVRCTTDVDLFLEQVASSVEQSSHCSFVCKTAYDYGYDNERNRPALQAILNRAAAEGLQLCPPEALYQLLMQQPTPIKSGMSCLVATKPVKDQAGIMLLPLFYRTAHTEGQTRTMLRMVAGDPFVTWSLRTTIMFCKVV